MDLFVLTPPGFDPLPVGATPGPAVGVLAYARLTGPETGQVTVLEHLRATRRAAPWAPLIVHAPMDDPSALCRIPRILTATGARAFVPEEKPTTTLLRTALVDPHGWRRHLPAWADLIAPDLPAVARAFLHTVLLGEQPPVVHSQKRLGSRQGNRCLALAGMGPRRRLLGVLHLATTLQFLWADPTRTVAEAALGSPTPYADATSFSNRCLDLVGCRPGQIRGLLSWEWVLWKALRGSRLRPT
jgi:hypothetical protein